MAAHWLAGRSVHAIFSSSVCSHRNTFSPLYAPLFLGRSLTLTRRIHQLPKRESDGSRELGEGAVCMHAALHQILDVSTRSVFESTYIHYNMKIYRKCIIILLYGLWLYLFCGQISSVSKLSMESLDRMVIDPFTLSLLCCSSSSDICRWINRVRGGKR